MIAELIRSLDNTIQYIQNSVADLSDQEMVLQPPNVPNHGAWTLGHVIFSCQGMAAELGSAPWLPDDWEYRFGFGSTPVADPSRYPAKSELLDKLADAVQRLRQTILRLPESAWKKTLPDEAFPTLGQLILQVVVAHSAYHAGQLAVWRRAIGKPSAGVFV